MKLFFALLKVIGKDIVAIFNLTPFWSIVFFLFFLVDVVNKAYYTAGLDLFVTAINVLYTIDRARECICNQGSEALK